MGAWIEIYSLRSIKTAPFVAPLVGAWIEIAILYTSYTEWYVAPLVGAWIEISGARIYFGSMQSLPLWERGLK